MGRRYTFKPMSEKNYLINNAASVTSGTTTEIVVADANDDINDSSIGVPGKVKAIFIQSAVYVDTLGIGGTMALALVKDIGNTMYTGFNPNGVISNPHQQNMIYYVRMSPSQANQPFKLFGWLKIPRRHQIFNEGDRLKYFINVVTVGGSADYSHCTTFIYKHQKA